MGGVKIPYGRGLLGHSDADVLLHAIADALLGAAALGDIGKHFPDNDPRIKALTVGSCCAASLRGCGIWLAGKAILMPPSSLRRQKWRHTLTRCGAISLRTARCAGLHQCQGDDHGTAWFHRAWRGESLAQAAALLTVV